MDSVQPAIPSWSEVSAIFQSSCGSTQSGCHTANAYDPLPEEGCRGWVAFVDESLGSVFDAGAGPEPTGCPDRSMYERLVELMSCQCVPDRRFVVPGDPDASYLVDKLEGRNLCVGIEGLSAEYPLSDAMPPPGYPPLSPEDKARIIAWIAGGAPGPAAP